MQRFSRVWRQSTITGHRANGHHWVFRTPSSRLNPGHNDEAKATPASFFLKSPACESIQESAVMNTLTTSFVRRLRQRDEAAWFELWEIFGPVIRAQLTKWGKGRIGVETVRDLTQETLAALSDSIDRYDPSRGARFSTWLLSIAKHALGDEIDRRMALKRGGGVKPTELDERFMGKAATVEADAIYEQTVFEAKVYAAIRRTEAEADFVQFQVYRMRVFDGQSGKIVAEQLGISEPTVSRHVQRVREELRNRVAEVVTTYSFTPDEEQEAEKAGLRGEDAMFDDAVAEIYHRQSQLVLDDEAGFTDSSY
jgi:RNA polymerase sigma factor (sigma-70 family)